MPAEQRPRIDFGTARASFTASVRSVAPQFAEKAASIFNEASRALTSRGYVPPASAFELQASFADRFDSTATGLQRILGEEGLKVVLVAVGVPAALMALGVTSTLAIVLCTVVALFLFCRDLRANLQQKLGDVLSSALRPITDF